MRNFLKMISLKKSSLAILLSCSSIVVVAAVTLPNLVMTKEEKAPQEVSEKVEKSAEVKEQKKTLEDLPTVEETTEVSSEEIAVSEVETVKETVETEASEEKVSTPEVEEPEQIDPVVPVEPEEEAKVEPTEKVPAVIEQEVDDTEKDETETPVESEEEPKDEPTEDVPEVSEPEIDNPEVIEPTPSEDVFGEEKENVCPPKEEEPSTPEVDEPEKVEPEVSVEPEEESKDEPMESVPEVSEPETDEPEVIEPTPNEDVFGEEKENVCPPKEEEPSTPEVDESEKVEPEVSVEPEEEPKDEPTESVPEVSEPETDDPEVSVKPEEESKDEPMEDVPEINEPETDEPEVSVEPEEESKDEPMESVPEVSEPETDEPEVIEPTPSEDVFGEEKENVCPPKEEEPSTPEVDEPEQEEPEVSVEPEEEPKDEPIEDVPEINEPETDEPEVMEPTPSDYVFGEEKENVCPPKEEESSTPEVDEPEKVEPEVSVEPEEEPKDEPTEDVPEMAEPSQDESEVPSEPKKEEVNDEPQVSQPEYDGPQIMEPEAKEPNVESEKQQEVVTQEPSVEKDNQAELIEAVHNAVEKTRAADSAYFIRKRTGIYPGEEKIKYSKSQNRQWYLYNDNLEEYTEGKEGNYPPSVGNGRVSSYYAQTHWSRTKEKSEWVKGSALISYFGISELGFLNDIKSVELKGTRPYKYYVITLDREVANQAAINLLNAGYYLEEGMFSSDVTVAIQVDNEGYIRSFDAQWSEDVLNNTNRGPITISVHMGDFNTTSVTRPKDLKDEPDERVKPSEELTATQKYNIENKIYSAFSKTRSANSVTYVSNGMTVKYDLQKNAALMSDDKATTYYEGNPGDYVDHNYVGPSYFHKSWTKLADSDVWTANPNRHKIFTPSELYFLNHDYIVISDVTKVETVDDITKYTVTILKYGANLAYSSVYGVDNKFTGDITMTVGLDSEGYIREMYADFGNNVLDLKLSDFNKTDVIKPADIK